MIYPIALKKKTILFLSAFFLVVLVIGVFSPVRNFDFINFDDNVYVTENPYVNTGLSWKNIEWAFTHFHGGHWHPLSWVSHQVDCQLFGLDPTPAHLANVFLHTASTVLLFYLLVRLFGLDAFAWLLAALFALHPLRVESVAWVTERKDVLNLFFGLLTLVSYERYQRDGSKKAYACMIVFFTIGILTKPALVALPIFCLLLDFWPFQKLTMKSFLEKIPLFLISFVVGIAAILAQDEAGALKSLNLLSVTERMTVALVGFWTYVFKTFWPTQLSVFYPLMRHPFSWGIFSLMGFVFASLLIFLFLKKYPMVLFGWLWFLIALLPIIGLLQIGGQAWANRWAYWPHVGVAIAVCGALQKIQRNKIPYAVLTFLIVLSIYRTSFELSFWKNSETLFARAVETSSPNFLAQNNLGLALEKRGDVEAAASHYEESIRIDPLYSEALNNLGSVKARQGDIVEAIPFFEKALMRNPNNPVFRYNLALARYMTGQKEKAIEEWRAITQASPDYAPAWESLRRTGH